MVVQFILDVIREIEERASSIGQEMMKNTKKTSSKGKKQTTITSAKKKKTAGKGSRKRSVPEQLEVIEEEEEEEEEEKGEKKEKKKAGEMRNDNDDDDKEEEETNPQSATPAENTSTPLAKDGGEEPVEIEIEVDEESIHLSQGDEECIFSQPINEQPEKEEVEETPKKVDSDSFDDEPEY